MTSGRITLSALCVLTLLGWTALGRAQQPAAPTVRDIAVEGNRRIQSPVILNRVQTRIGDTFSPSGIREDVRSIFTLGFFDDVQVRTEEFEGGIRLIFIVTERPLVREVGFEGNDDLKTEELRERAGIRVGVLYNPVEVQRAIDAIRLRYEEEGFFGVQLTPRTERTPEGDLRVVIRVVEGSKMYIDRIVIEGNEAISSRTIKNALLTQERLFWILPFSKVSRKVFEEDAERVINVYADNGYVQARVESQEIVPDFQRNKLTLRIRVVEGPQFRTGAVTFRGNEILTDDQIRPLIRLKEGDVFNRSLLRTTVRSIADRYSEIGRVRADVTPSTDIDVAALRVGVAFTIREGPEVYVERINIRGNTKSSEKVLRREMRVVEGELLTNQKLVRSRQRLFNLGYFDEVNISTEPGSTPERVVVNVDVRERATGVFSVGAGYSSLDNVFATIDITQRNLFGRGQEVYARFRIGAESRLGQAGFTEPYLFDIPLRAGFDVYDREREYPDFTEERLGGDLRASYPLQEYVILSALYRLESVEISDVAEDASDDLKRELGTKLNSVVELALARDTRDNIFEPTQGSRSVVDASFAGLGGDTRFYKMVAEHAHFFPLPIFNWIFAARGQIGYAHGWGGEEVPIFERFFLGGATTLRGQGTREVGPRDENGAVIGGTSTILGSVELLIPVFPRFRLVLFFDAGNAYGFGTSFDPTDLRLGAGGGFRFFSPLGPLRLEVGYNLDRQSGEDAYQIHFAVGSPF